MAACGAGAAGRSRAADRRADDYTESDPEGQARFGAFGEGHQKLGCIATSLRALRALSF